MEIAKLLLLFAEIECSDLIEKFHDSPGRGGGLMYRCLVCNKESPHCNNIKRHVIGLHMKVKQEECVLCAKKYKNIYQLKKHQRLFHSIYKA
jgi:hypothetical protein